MIVRTLTPSSLVKYLDKYYGYQVTREVAIKILTELDELYGEFTEYELIDVVEKYLEESL